MQDFLPAFQVIRPGIGQRLEEAECDQQFADAADILPGIAAVFGLAGVVRIGQIKHGNAVSIGIWAQQRFDLCRESRIRLRQD